MQASVTYPLKSFLEMAILKVAVGELNGVFHKPDPSVVVMDVFLPDDQREFGRAWQGSIYVSGGGVIEALRRLHKDNVLAAYRSHVVELQTRGVALIYPAPPNTFELEMYRSRIFGEVADEITKIVIEAKVKPRYKGCPISFTVFEEFPGDGGASVTIRYVPALKKLIFTSPMGVSEEEVLTTKGNHLITARCIEFIEDQGIKLLGPRVAEAIAA